MFAAATTYSDEIYAFLRDRIFGGPTLVAVAALAPIDNSCPVAELPQAEPGNILVMDGFDVDAQRFIPAEQYTNPRTGKPYEIVRITGEGGNRDFQPGTCYRLPEGITFLPAMLNARTNSAPYVVAPLWQALDRLRCVAAKANGEVRVNKALLSNERQRYWETDRDVPALGLGQTGVHLQIVEGYSDKRTPWDHPAVAAAADKANLAVPSPETYRAYVKLSTGR